MSNVQSRSNAKLKILVESWFNIPHSYAIVTCFVCIFWEKYFSDRVEVYIREKPYFRDHWNEKRGLFYPEEYNQIIRNLKVAPDDFLPDVVYRATYPYDISPPMNNGNVPVVVFYTSEFAALDLEYFSLSNPPPILDDNFIKNYIIKNKQLWFTTPSQWSARGLERYTGIQSSRNRVITHGIDTDIFKPDRSNRQQIRQLYNIKEDDIVFLNIGAMTQNKGIIEILLILRALVFPWGGGDRIKLMLKGTGDLYECRAMVEQYLTMLNLGDEGKRLLEKNIIFTDKTLTCTRINDLYNACDIYVSPYVAEGFNLTVLEAIAAGMRVVVSDNGSTSDFVNCILENVSGMDMRIRKIKTEVVRTGDSKGSEVLKVNLDNFLGECIAMIGIGNNPIPKELTPFMEKNYSWKKVCEELLEYLDKIVN